MTILPLSTRQCCRFLPMPLFACLLVGPSRPTYAQAPVPSTPSPGTAVTPAANQQSPSRPATPVTPAPALFSLDLKATPLRQALESLFTNGRVQYSLAPDLPDTPITLRIRDQSLEESLRLLLQQGGSGTQRVTYTKEAGVYRIQTMPATLEPVETEQIALVNVPPSAIVAALQTAFPSSLLLTDGRSSSLLVRAPAAQQQDIRQMARLLDVVPHTVVLKAEVVMVTEGGGVASRLPKTANGSVKAPSGSPSSSRATLLSTILRTLSGQEAVGDDKLMGTAAQSAKLQLTATPTRLGDGSYQLDTRWEVSLPLPTGTRAAGAARTDAGGVSKGASLVRLEKRLSTTSRLRSGETVVMGGVVLSQYGLKGEILFFVTLTDATP